MGYNVNEKEFMRVIKLPSDIRYHYFVKKIIDFEEIWSLWNSEGWALTLEPEGQECIPFWPAKKYADACINGNWENMESKSISLENFSSNWLQGMIKDEKLLAIFPTPQNKGIVIPPQRLISDLEKEVDKYGF